MASPLTDTATLTSPQNEYKNFLRITASRLSKFKPLDTFLHSKTNVPARITAIKFRNGSVPSKESDINELELENQLKHRNDPNDHQLFIVENITPNVVALIGHYCKVDPQFFLDYLDAVLLSEFNPIHSLHNSRVMETLPWARLGKIWEHVKLFETKLPQNSHRQIESLSWYRLGNIEEHLPALRSVQRDMNHIHIRYIGPREYQPTDPITSPTELPDHIEPEQDKSNVERVAGGHIPIPLEGQRFYPAAMTRHSAAAWFDGDKSKPWQTG